MNMFQAYRIISDLVYGYDSDTGQKVSKESLLQNPETLEALSVALTAMDQLNKNVARQWWPEKRGSAWRKVDEQQLLVLYNEGIPINVIAIILQRQERAVRDRLLLNGIKPHYYDDLYAYF